MKTRVSRARALHPHDQNSPDPLNTTKQLFFDLRCILRRSHSKGMDIETTKPTHTNAFLSTHTHIAFVFFFFFLHPQSTFLSRLFFFLFFFSFGEYYLKYLLISNFLSFLFSISEKKKKKIITSIYVALFFFFFLLLFSYSLLFF